MMYNADRVHIHVVLRAWICSSVVLALVQTSEAKDDASYANPEDAPQVALGQRIYSEHCASCHGVDLEGEQNWRSLKASGRLPAPPHDETGHTWHHPDWQLFRITKLGPAEIVGDGYESDMPGFADVLTDKEIWATLAFIKSRWPQRIRARHDRINKASKK